MSGPVRTWDVLRSLGFANGKPGWAFSEGLVYSFGPHVLYCQAALNKYFRRIIQFSGVWSDGRHITEVSFEIPDELESRAQGVAWLVDAIDHHKLEGRFFPASAPYWMAEGRENKHLLPWEIERAQRLEADTLYGLRPKCLVDREWMKLAIRNLRDLVAGVADDEPVTFSFDGRALRIEVAGKAVSVWADGEGWPEPHSVPAADLRRLPTRLMTKSVDVSIWEGRLRIGSDVFGKEIQGDLAGRDGP